MSEPSASRVTYRGWPLPFSAFSLLPRFPACVRVAFLLCCSLCDDLNPMRCAALEPVGLPTLRCIYTKDIDRNMWRQALLTCRNIWHISTDVFWEGSGKYSALVPGCRWLYVVYICGTPESSLWSFGKAC